MNLRQIIRESIDSVILDSIISEAIEEEIGSAEQAQPGSGGQTTAPNQQQNTIFKQYADQLRKLFGNSGIDPKPVQNNQAASQHIVKLNRFVFAVMNAIDSGNINSVNSPAAGKGYNNNLNKYGEDKVDHARRGAEDAVNYLGGQAENLLGNGAGLQNNPLNGVFSAGVKGYNDVNNLFTQQMNRQKYADMYGDSYGNNNGYDLCRLMTVVADGCYPRLRDEYIQLNSQNNGIFSATPNVGNCYDVLNNLYNAVQQYMAQSKQKTQAGDGNGQQNTKTGQPENGKVGGEAGSPENGVQPEGTPQEKLFRIYEELTPLAKQITEDGNKLAKKYPKLYYTPGKGTKDHLRQKTWMYHGAFAFVYWHINRGYSNNDENELRNAITAKNTNTYYEGSSFSNYTTIDMALKMFDYGNVYANKLGGVWKKIYSSEYISKAKELLEEYNNIAKQLIANGQPLLPQQQTQAEDNNDEYSWGDEQPGSVQPEEGQPNNVQPEEEQPGNGAEIEPPKSSGKKINFKLTDNPTYRPDYSKYINELDKNGDKIANIVENIENKTNDNNVVNILKWMGNLSDKVASAIQNESYYKEDYQNTKVEPLTKLMSLDGSKTGEEGTYEWVFWTYQKLHRIYEKMPESNEFKALNEKDVVYTIQSLRFLYTQMRRDNIVDKPQKNNR